MMSACTQALALPELVAIILSHVSERRSLFACIQVNRLWADEAVTFLWSQYPPLRALKALEDFDSSRLDYYASKICALEFDKEYGEYLELFSTSTFGRLISLNVDNSKYRREKELRHFLRHLPPRLRRLKIKKGPTTDALLLQIQVSKTSSYQVTLDNELSRSAVRVSIRSPFTTVSVKSAQMDWSSF